MNADKLVFLGAALASLLVAIGALIFVLREPGLRLKPFWAILSFVGVGGAVMVWRSPDQVYWFFGIALPTVSFSAGEGSWQPEIVRTLFPLGAILVLIRIWWHRICSCEDTSAT